MKTLHLEVLTACAFLACFRAYAQTVCMNAAEHRPCTEVEAKEMQDKICHDESAPANLFVAHPVLLTGRFLDPSGAPINFDAIKHSHQTIVQIKHPVSAVILFAVPLRPSGEFEFESVREGNYRLILVWMKDGGFKRLPLSDQPKEIRCSDLRECRISSVITFHGSDNPIDSCPPK